MAGGGGDTVFRQFVLILSFVALCGMMLILFAQTFAESANVGNPDSKLPEIYNVFGDLTITAFNASGAGAWNNGYNVTNASVVNKVPKGEHGGFTFGTVSDPNDKRVYVVRDNEQYNAHQPNLLIADMWTHYTDFIGIKRTADDWVGGEVYRYAIPLTELVRVFDPETNTSRYNFPLSGSNYTILLKLPNNDTTNIWNNNYVIYLGTNLLSNKINFWSAIKMLYTGSIPNCNIYLNRMIQAMVIFTTIFVVYEMATRIIPF